MPSETQPSARVLHTHTPALFDAAVAEVAGALRHGDVVALPTETVYGLAANALDAQAVARIYQIKQRPDHNPLIVHIAGAEMARRCAARWTEMAARLALAFWPGPLTLVVERASAIPPIVTAGGETVGLRWPSHPFTQAVIRACGFPLAAPSANRSNELSPTTAEHVRRGLGQCLSLIVDGGASQIGIESTVVDVTGDRPRILRPGMIPLDSIAAALGDLAPNMAATSSASSSTPDQSSESRMLRSPGLLERHYAPRARLIIEDSTRAHDLRERLQARGIDPRECHVIAHTCIPSGDWFASVRVIPHDAEAYARAIYAELHRCDDEGAKCIIVEAVPTTPAWQGIADRLRRAARG